MNSALGLMRKYGLKRADLHTKLESIVQSMTLEDYEQFQTIVRLPKPTYLKGITIAAEQFITNRLAEGSLKQPDELRLILLPVLRHSVTFTNVSVHYTSFVARTKKTQTVQKAFG